MSTRGITEGQTRMSDFTFTFHFHALEKEMATHSSVLAWRIPGMGKPGGLPSMGLHRVGHDWSDLAVAVDIVKVNVAQSCLTLRPHGLYSPWNSPGQNTGVGSFTSPGDLPNPGIKPRSPTLQADSLPAEPQGKPKNPGVGSLSLLQGIFPTQESNQGFLHCRGILYQLSYILMLYLFIYVFFWLNHLAFCLG